MKILKLLLAVFVVTLLFSQCKYNFIVPDEVEVIDPDDPDAPQVSFADDILPIFNDGNYCTSCHTTGKTQPDLTPDKAFAAINSTRYINSASPEESKIYKYPSPSSATHMQKKYSSSQAATVLLWIQQGAKNN
jgi:hypothetical protein